MGINKAITERWAASEYDEDAIPNHILIPPENYAYIVSTRIGTSGDENILSYLLKNNMSTAHGVDLVIAPSRWCIAAGVGGVNRMIVYKNDEDFLYFDLPVPLTRCMTQPSLCSLHILLFMQLRWGRLNIFILSLSDITTVSKEE